ncbi:MAG: hypothetical protein NTY94_09665 [Alphaproteobacteria bacterium]|jgi:hypothetical protein|nr:hypothetical protein [Alphaproteobacteria bacterium]
MPRLLLATVAALALAAPAQAIGAAGGAGTTPIGLQSMGANGPITYDTQVMGGRGALIGAQFALTSGTVLQIAVGGMGNSGTGLFAPGGGGGGSFVVGPGDTPLVIGGGRRRRLVLELLPLQWHTLVRRRRRHRQRPRHHHPAGRRGRGHHPRTRFRHHRPAGPVRPRRHPPPALSHRGLANRGAAR